MPRTISKKRARFLEKRGEFVYRGIDGKWWWTRTIEYLNRWKYDYSAIDIADTKNNKSGFIYSKVFIPDCKMQAYNKRFRKPRQVGMVPELGKGYGRQWQGGTSLNSKTDDRRYAFHNGARSGKTFATVEAFKKWLIQDDFTDWLIADKRKFKYTATTTGRTSCRKPKY